MNLSRRQFLKLGGMTAAMVSLSQADLTAWASAPPQIPAATNPALHLLNRIAYHVDSAELARAQSIGLVAYLEEQLHPETIDDGLADDQLRLLPLLGMSREDLYLVDSYRVEQAMIQGFVVRAVHSKRQLLERMTEFWADHFNVAGEDYARENAVFQHTVVRANALGNFRDMLFATAKSPAMLYYLDNFSSKAEHPNENYARELLELHTLGVDGGYTEQDVVGVARAFTGWTVHNGVADGFYFDDNNHDMGEKQILGHILPSGRGIEDGLHVLSILANHPQTAHHLSRKLCRRFISDNPPQSIIDSTVQVWVESGGDIKTILRHLFASDEFMASVGQKFRRPLDFVIGAFKATGTTLDSNWTLYELLSRSGQIPYHWGPPNGYPDAAGAWINTSSLLFRWNAAMYLAEEAYSDPYFEGDTQLRERIGNPDTIGLLVDRVAEQVFGVPLSPDLAAPFLAYVAEGEPADARLHTHTIASKLGTLYAFMLASPLYQWR